MTALIILLNGSHVSTQYSFSTEEFILLAASTDAVVVWLLLDVPNHLAFSVTGETIDLYQEANF